MTLALVSYHLIETYCDLQLTYFGAFWSGLALTNQHTVVIYVSFIAIWVLYRLKKMHVSINYTLYCLGSSSNIMYVSVFVLVTFSASYGKNSTVFRARAGSLHLFTNFIVYGHCSVDMGRPANYYRFPCPFAALRIWHIWFGKNSFFLYQPNCFLLLFVNEILSLLIKY